MTSRRSSRSFLRRGFGVVRSSVGVGHRSHAGKSRPPAIACPPVAEVAKKVFVDSDDLRDLSALPRQWPSARPRLSSFHPFLPSVAVVELALLIGLAPALFLVHVISTSLKCKTFTICLAVQSQSKTTKTFPTEGLKPWIWSNIGAAGNRRRAEPRCATHRARVARHFVFSRDSIP